MKKKRDILFLCQYFYPEYVSSATLPYDTAVALSKAGFSVSVLCGYPEEYNNAGKVPAQETISGIEIKRVKYFQSKRSSFLGRLANNLSFFFAIFFNFFLINNYKSVIVYSNPYILSLVGALASKVFDVKMFFVCYDVYPEIACVTHSISRSGVLCKIFNVVNKIVFRCAHVVVAISNEMKEYLINHREFLSGDRVCVIPNWYEDATLKDKNISFLNKKFSSFYSKKSLIVSYFGNMGICQDMDVIIGAMRFFRNDDEFFFVFAGHGTKMIEIERIIKEEKFENAVVYEFLHGEDFQDALAVSDVFLVSLISGLSGLAVPSKAYSYMMAGKPVVAILDSGMDIARDILDNHAGFVVTPGHVEDLISAIKALKKDENARVDMGKRVRKIFLEKYTKNKCVKLYVNLMQNELGKDK